MPALIREGRIPARATQGGHWSASQGGSSTYKASLVGVTRVDSRANMEFIPGLNIC